MKYHILTLFPEMIEQGLHTSILGRAINNGYISSRRRISGIFQQINSTAWTIIHTAEVRAWSWRRSGVPRLPVGSRKDREKAADGLSDTAGKSIKPDDGRRAGT